MFDITSENIGLLAAAAVAAYLIGNISPSILMARARGIDIRKEGSGNAGTTNALRVMGKKAGAVTLVVDILKGTGAVLLGSLMAGHAGAMVCTVAVFCGHVWPVFFRFKGGKGVATAFGALLGLNPLLALSALAIVITGVLISRRMSVGSLAGAVSFPFIAMFFERDFVILGSVMAVIILIKHRGNIARLFRGEEPVMSIFEKKKTSQEEK
ncbi:MAG TPA: glycerol-3-phosphate 1-O-acyltransferase PlsY [Candidatus Copromorpha excrementigallinarum]|uniref:Glycerol-3-phosphate acyltransferase n=1 Tax=Candidatus Allocopromorpha excrementigallinarum TaxID=2840742 RepID=A0A9D1I1K3_9FIRM|nr:glycerol-3-phosphate 1-O-acyltransferase PlsY [Candidatus Copromorpha excrementigallinarum]